MISSNDLQKHIVSGTWRDLETFALAEIASSEQRSGSVMSPVLGGGTRLMLDLEHRVSDDIDLFLTSPQWIGYLTPRLTDRKEHGLTDYVEGGATLKLIYPQGEIDFICCLNLTDFEPVRHEKTAFLCEDPYEVLAKKLFHRGPMLTARDLFDWRSLIELAPDEEKEKIVMEVISRKIPAIEAALDALGESQAAQKSWSLIKTPLEYNLAESVDFAKDRLPQRKTNGYAP